jgi:AraC-like DNA-binding protein
MKNDENGIILSAISHLLSGPLAEVEALHLAEPSEPDDDMRYSYHSHETWELFCPLQGDLKFVVGSQSVFTIPACHLLIVPPGCLHCGVYGVKQSKELSLLVMNLPCEYSPYGGLTIDHSGERSSMVLSEKELSEWTAITGMVPERLIEQAVEALESGHWGRERALGLLRILVAAFAEVSSQQKQDRLTLDIRRVAEARLFIRGHYHDSTLSVETVATAVGLSASHLQTIFKKVTGYTPRQTLIDLRMRRANELLVDTNLSIKEIASMTGWGSQLYFSAAYHRRHGHPPSAARSNAGSK